LALEIFPIQLLNLYIMKKLRLFALILAAIMVAQLANAQIVRDEWVFPLENTWLYCLDENVTGTLVYDVKYKFDKDDNLVSFSLHNKGGFLTGESGTIYKLIDVSKDKYGVPPKADELMINGIYKIIAPGQGIVYDGRVQIHIDVNKCGELIYKKSIWDLCFTW
jgi:hypothetical protein